MKRIPGDSEAIKKWIDKPRHAVLTEDGVVMPCDLMTWARFLGGKQRIIKQEELEGAWISTVFLGLDHNYWLSGPQLWFETMIFQPRSNGASPVFLDRYSTLAEALEGHESAKRRFERGEFESEIEQTQRF